MQNTIAKKPIKYTELAIELKRVWKQTEVLVVVTQNHFFYKS